MSRTGIAGAFGAESPDRFAAVEAASEALFWDIDTEEDYEKVLSGLRDAPPSG